MFKLFTKWKHLLGHASNHNQLDAHCHHHQQRPDHNQTGDNPTAGQARGDHHNKHGHCGQSGQ